MKTKLTFSLSDLRQAVYQSNTDCPLAKALKRVLKKGYKPFVGACGSFEIESMKNRKTLFCSDVNNFDAYVVENAKRQFSRVVEIPSKYLK